MRASVIFILALAMGGLTTVLLFTYLNDEGKAEVKKNMVQVVRATEDIEQNTTITNDMLETVEVSENEVHPQAVKNKKEAEGRFATGRIVKGEILLSHRLQTQVDEKRIVSNKIKPGFRAVSVGVNAVQSVSNLIEPEDFVDIMYTELLKDGSVGQTKQILSNVRVLAIGQSMTPPTSSEEAFSEYNSITVELKQDDAKELVNASEKGKVHFTLHSGVDQTNK
ncbi:Flp pilus assembly protein CpaB [Aquibacillus sp. 3ASR75-11]|uniref:Flp pilus assembly protein CpaB n=2 Tax=Terrihalobacillus insolitus TaxID=2950438 RepID=A0A9X3WVS2_9BACI|nr:Flp pilus assembly protein CpaB [Terrihalobacillus insolitus]MDC3425478.1 Flp pilus assembly protein CpaB [Terrihalobacillus insolitus]